MLTATEPKTVEKRTLLSNAIEASRTDFLSYVKLLNPASSGYVLSEVHQYLIQMIQEIVDGKRTKRQAVSLPPQHGKSRVLSVEAAAWLIGRVPGIQLAITGYSQDLTIGFAKMVRSRLQGQLHLAVFPGSAPMEGSNRADAFECDNGSSMRAKSVGAKLTGRKVDWLIVDDPHSGREEAESPTQRKKVVDWYYADCFSRLSPGASVFLIQTRWHPEDLVGTLTNEEKVQELTVLNQAAEIFEVTNFPAVAQENDVLGRAEGEALFPEIRNLPFLNAVKATIPSYEWESQYMGDPQGHSGEQFDARNLNYIGMDEVPWNRLEIVRGWDLALTEKDTSNYSSGNLMGYDGVQDFLYIIDVFRIKGTWVKVRRLMLELSRKEAQSPEEEHQTQNLPYRTMRVGIEGIAGFLATYQDIKHQLMGEVKVEVRNAPSGDKLTRALPWLAKIEAKKVFIVRAGWNKEYVNELKLFPLGTFDDQVDATSVGWEMLTGRYRHGFLTRDGKVVRPNSVVRPSSANRPHGGMARHRLLELQQEEETKNGDQKRNP